MPLAFDVARRDGRIKQGDLVMLEAMGGGTVNTMVLEERDGKTLMTLTVNYRSKEARDAVLQTPMEWGAGESFDRLEELLATLV